MKLRFTIGKNDISFGVNKNACYHRVAKKFNKLIIISNCLLALNDRKFLP